MVPGQKNIILRYTLIMFIMALLAIAIIAKAAIIMFAERQYWKDVADRFIKENVIVHPTRGLKYAKDFIKSFLIKVQRNSASTF